MKKKIMIAGILTLSMAGMVFATWYINKPQEKKEEVLQYVDITPNEKLYINGTVESEKESKVYIDTDYSDITEVYVKDQAKVKEGDNLYKGHSKTITSQIEECQEQISAYETELDNYSYNKNKITSKISSLNSKINKLKESSRKDETLKLENDAKIEQYESEIDSYEEQETTNNRQAKQVQTSIDSMNSKIAKLKKQEYKVVKAKVTGKVYVSEDTADITKPYMMIYSDTLIVDGQIDEKSREKIKKDDTVEIKLVSNSKKTTGVVQSISEIPSEQIAAEGVTTTALSKYDMVISIADQKGLVRGYHIQAVYEVPQNVIRIPEEALVVEGEQGYVYKMTNNQVTKWMVTYEESEEKGYVDVSNGITVDDKVILNVQEYLKGIEENGKSDGAKKDK